MPELTDIDDLPKTTHADVFETQRPRTVRLQLEAGERIPAHTHPGSDIVLFLVSGRLALSLDGETYDVEPNQLVRFSGDREISPHAIEASTAILVFAPADDDHR